MPFALGDRTARSPASDAAMVVIERASKMFLARDATQPGGMREVVALESISAVVGRGEMIVLLGPSGCGKTTLLRMAAGLSTIDEGTITIDGRPVVGPRKDACMVFQHFGLLPWRTVEANVEFPLELDGVPAKQRHDRAHELLKIVGLERFARYYPHEISGGMQQRVGIARALMRRPIVLFMDEPFGALDAQSREQLQDDFLKIWSEFRTTVLFVTHSIDEALTLADRIVVFTPGPGRVKAIIQSPLAAERIGGDVRTHPDYGRCRSELRNMLRSADA
jgi:NitT/TauT family transport system ATP-binding protein